ncbi:hypothetical protein EW146_g6097 [Bondarzewia mesenterica]|uniref:Fibronectin type-III domain-containing protein n=1 Tax=Bondarzewia mesenterica TaxID=1095465 RepID=A0A4S4LQ69_9AGAM|nr:hypothetical protein EW146_g6097 [Bondarzewia mesenterica]
MKSFAIVASLVSLLPAVLGLTVDTPASVVQCEPVLLTWHDGTPPYFLSFVPANQPSAPAIKSFPQQSGTSLTWLVDLQANTNFNIGLKDSTGNQVYSALVTVQSSSNSSCLNTSVNEGSSTTASGASGNSSSAAPSASGSASVTGSRTSSVSASATATRASTSSNGGSRSTVATFGIAGLMGLVGAALF